MIRSRMTLGTLALAAVATLTLALGMPSLAGPAASHAKTAVSRGKMGKPAAIKVAKGTNTRGKEVHKKRAEVATVHVDNHTGWYIDVYVDGDYAGQVGPYGDIYPLVYSGDHIFSAVAPFDDGSTKTWGPSTYYVGSAFTWTLTD